MQQCLTAFPCSASDATDTSGLFIFMSVANKPHQQITISDSSLLTNSSGNELFIFFKMAYKRQEFDARELHNVLNIGHSFHYWIRRHAQQFEFVPERDFHTKEMESTGGRPAIQHIISFRMGMELIIMTRAKKSRQVRRCLIDYFFSLLKKKLSHH